MDDLQSDEFDRSKAEEMGIDTLHNPDKLINLASWAKILSWAILVIMVLTVVINLLYLFSEPAGQFTLGSIISLLSTLSLAGFFFLGLQGMAEIIYLLLDMEERIRISHHV